MLRIMTTTRGASLTPEEIIARNNVAVLGQVDAPVLVVCLACALPPGGDTRT